MKKQKRVFIIVSLIALFVAGYLFSHNVLEKLISDSEFSYYEQVARDVYEQGSKSIYEVPETVSLETTDTQIIISSAKTTRRGKVCATIQNGELVFNRDKETAEAISINLVVGIMFVLVGVVLYTIPTPKRVQKKN